MTKFDVVYNLKVTGMETLKGETEKLSTEMRHGMMLMQQMMTLVSRGDLTPQARQGLNALASGMMGLQLGVRAYAQFSMFGIAAAPGIAFTAGLALIGYMNSISEHSTLESMLSAYIMDSEAEGRMNL